MRPMPSGVLRCVLLSHLALQHYFVLVVAPRLATKGSEARRLIDFKTESLTSFG